ncbi:MAG: GTPase [Cyanobacteria bacterium CRU_2_1]|nr:GTPase [Cyanobacteria bacterium RU_5_0]NJR60551.1 GTPase [Cyanobacteria bacterium CRU_2_1]
MEVMRLVITGPVGAGKSTFIHTVSEIPVVSTDRTATDKTAELKKTTTVALDFGKFTFEDSMTLYLYGTPGQSRFDFMWDLLIRRAHAYILLVAAHRPEAFREARQIVTFMNQRVNIPMMIGVTHIDCEGAWTMEDVQLAIVGTGNLTPVIAVNANEKASVTQSLVALLEHYLQSSVPC